MLSESQNIEYKETWRDEYLKPKQLTPADLMRKHSSYPRNHNIANVFFKAGFVESWGRGFKKIREEFERANMPLPTIEENGGGVTAIIFRKTIEDIIEENGGNSGGNEGVNDDNVGVNVGNVLESELTERQRFIITAIRSNPYVTGKQMSETLSVTQRTVERDLAVMQKAGIIRREGSDKAGIWVVLEKLK